MWVGLKKKKREKIIIKGSIKKIKGSRKKNKWK
jgi:hypothetical protein